MDFTCPLCQSHHATRLALVQAKGRSRTRSWGITVGGGGIFGLALTFFTLPFRLFGFVSVTRERGTTETYLARETAPPYRIPLGKIAVIGFVVTFAFLLPVPAMVQGVLAPASPALAGLLGGLGSLAVFAFYGLAIAGGAAYNRKVWPQKEAEWQRAFLCGRCGATYVVPEYNPYGERPVRSDHIGHGDGLPRAEQPQAREQARARAAADFTRRKTRDPV